MLGTCLRRALFSSYGIALVDGIGEYNLACLNVCYFHGCLFVRARLTEEYNTGPACLIGLCRSRYFVISLAAIADNRYGNLFLVECSC